MGVDAMRGKVGGEEDLERSKEGWAIPATLELRIRTSPLLSHSHTFRTAQRAGQAPIGQRRKQSKLADDKSHG